ncbi:TetR family transcriptional regulator [Curtobacterium sp. MCJR17_043]|uniref:acyl-CoA-like ligand-binding transcription factor n=1 Tax=Curtobacterium sp. MCJR17_043 TaxID=2175660 RepID=UPI0024DF84D1|nr:TetR family transcriptional regulator [Curtobacterium sp. MCJR17_043]WIB36736.1 TetR family transcriptional regulator [Curtobacterium sp. MCJR17_043]
MSETAEARPGLRDIARDAVRARIAAVAIARFDAEGFDRVTVEQVAAEAGISARSFHRYFPAKEDAVIGDPARHGAALAAAFGARPADEPVWSALREAFVAMLEHGSDDDPETGRRSVRVMLSTPSLRARNTEKHHAWAEVLLPLVVDRLGGDGRRPACADGRAGRARVLRRLGGEVGGGRRRRRGDPAAVVRRPRRPVLTEPGVVSLAP